MEMILWLQAGANSWLDVIFTFFTMLGTAEFYLVAIPLIYWTISAEVGAALAVVFPFSMWLNAWLKEFWHLPRPPVSLVRAIPPETDYGLPSGHAQGSVTFWGYLALRSPRRWFVLLAVAIILMISFSRLYLGVHYPADVLAGWVIGAVVLLAAWWLLDRRGAKMHWWWLAVTAVAAALFLLVPELARAGQITGSAAGAALGYAWQKRYVDWHPAGPWGGRLALAVTGLVVLQAVRQGLKLGLGVTAPADFARYVIIGFLAYAVLPWLFQMCRRPGSEKN